MEELNNELKTIEAQTSSLAVGLVSAVLANAMNDDTLKFHLQEIGKEMNKFCEIYQNASDASFVDLYKSTYESSAQLLELFSNDLHLDVSATISDDLKRYRFTSFLFCVLCFVIAVCLQNLINTI